MMDDVELHMMVGEIRSDVKKLLKSDDAYDKRIRKLEHRQWWMTGVGATLAVVFAKFGAADFAHFWH